MRENGSDASVLKPSYGIGGTDAPREDGHEFTGGIGFTPAVPHLEYRNGKTLSRPVGAISFTIDNRCEFHGIMDAIEDLCIQKPGYRVDTIQEPHHRFKESPFASIFAAE
jgi:hypothetical protein